MLLLRRGLWDDAVALVEERSNESVRVAPTGSDLLFVAN